MMNGTETTRSSQSSSPSSTAFDGTEPSSEGGNNSSSTNDASGSGSSSDAGGLAVGSGSNRYPSLFIQGFAQLGSLDPLLLRSADQAWQVHLQREGADDAGGPFRESISEFCADILSPQLALFLPCPNASAELGFNQDKFLPNPSANSPNQLGMFEFIGKMIGIALRTKTTLDLALPSLVWKSLLATKLEWSDLEAVDKSCCQFLDGVRHTDKEGITRESFNDLIFESFTTRSIDGRVVELKPGGSNIDVTWDNRHEFVALVEQFRLHEFRAQTDAMARGIDSVVPRSVLTLLTWQQLEDLVWGQPAIDLELLRRQTVYRSVSPSAPHVQAF